MAQYRNDKYWDGVARGGAFCAAAANLLLFWRYQVHAEREHSFIYALYLTILLGLSVAVYALLQKRSKIHLRLSTLVASSLGFAVLVYLNLLKDKSMVPEGSKSFMRGWPCPFYLVDEGGTQWFLNGFILDAFTMLLILTGLAAFWEYWRKTMDEDRKE